MSEKRFPVSQREVFGIWVTLDNGVECWATEWLIKPEGPCYTKPFFPSKKDAEVVLASGGDFGFKGFVSAEVRPATLPYPKDYEEAPCDTP